MPTQTATPTSTPVASLSGRVTDAATGKGIAGARVEAWRGWQHGAWQYTRPLSGGREPYVVMTASDGSYAMFGLPKDDYLVRVVATDLAREYYDNASVSSEARPVPVSLTRASAAIDFSLTEGGSVSGHIYESDGATPIGGAEVWVRPGKYMWDEGFWARTESDGSYTVQNLPLGAYRITAFSSGHTRLGEYYDRRYGWEDATDVAVAPPGNTPAIDLRLELAGSISGRAYSAKDGIPIAGLNIWADNLDGSHVVSFHANSGDGGEYVIEGVLPGLYTVNASSGVISRWYAAEFYDNAPSRGQANPVRVIAGVNTPKVDFPIEEGGRVTGHVYDGVTRAPLQHVVVVPCLSNGDCSVPAVVDTLPDGSYSTTLEEGQYLIRAHDPGMGTRYVGEWYNDAYEMGKATALHVTVHQVTSGIDFYLARSGSISGHVYDADGHPVSDASVYAFGDAHPGSGANTQADGGYTIHGLPSGKYVVQVSVSGYVSQFHKDVGDRGLATKVKVNAPGNTGTIDFHLRRAAE